MFHPTDRNNHEEHKRKFWPKNCIGNLIWHLRAWRNGTGGCIGELRETASVQGRRPVWSATTCGAFGCHAITTTIGEPVLLSIWGCITWWGWRTILIFRTRNHPRTPCLPILQTIRTTTTIGSLNTLWGRLKTWWCTLLSLIQFL